MIIAIVVEPNKTIQNVGKNTLKNKVRLEESLIITVVFFMHPFRNINAYFIEKEHGHTY